MSLYSTSSEGVRHIYFSHSTSGSNLVVADTYTSNISVKKTLSYSIDNIIWSQPVELSLYVANPLPPGVSKMFFRLTIELQYITFSDSVNYSLDSITINGENIDIDRMEIGQQLEKVLSLNTSVNTFNPYRFSDFQKDLYDKLSIGVNEIIGFPVLYFRTESDSVGENITFKTYTLNKVVEVKQIKISIENNNIPDNLERFDQFGFDFQEELIIHIVKQEFWKAFGTDKIPNSNDYFYWPFTDRMYMLNSPYERKTFMQHATYWAAVTSKFENRSTTKRIEDDDEFHNIDNIIEFVHDYKADLEVLEQEDAAKDFNEPNKNFSNLGSSISDDDNDQFEFSFDYTDKPIDVPHKTSNFFQQFKEGENIILSSWLKINSAQDIFELNSDSQDLIKISTIENGEKLSFVVHYSTTIVDDLPPINISMMLNTEIEKNQWYGIVMRLFGNDLSLDLYNSEIEEISTTITNVTKIKNYPTNIDIFGGIKFNLLRVSKTDINNIDLLTDKLPDKKKFVMLMNATPNITSEPKEE